ncbi:MAG: Rieske (2Fe-2S) protein, partial [Candidatus Kapaibacterium sp.]
VRAAQDKYVALENRCTHKGRRIDPLAGEDLVQCCSLGKSTFDLAGRRIEGSANDDIAIYPAELLDNRLKITLFDAKFPGEAF